MASAWGASFGSAFGDSWGAIAASTGISGGGFSRNRKRLIYIEEDRVIKVFRNATDAAKYTKAKKQHQKPEVSYEAIDLSMLDRYEERLGAIFYESPVVAYRAIDIGLLLEMAIKARKWRDEEDILMLVMQ